MPVMDKKLSLFAIIHKNFMKFSLNYDIMIKTKGLAP